MYLIGTVISSISSTLSDTKIDQKLLWCKRFACVKLFLNIKVSYGYNSSNQIISSRALSFDEIPGLVVQSLEYKNNRISKESYIFDNHAKTFVLTKNEIDYSKNTTEQIVKFAFENNLQSIIIEGGAHTLQTFIDNNLWDEARIFVGAKFLENGKK